jgi:hypothetical protein
LCIVGELRDDLNTADAGTAGIEESAFELHIGRLGLR